MDPSNESVGDIAGVGQCAATFFKVTAGGNTAAVILPRSPVPGASLIRLSGSLLLLALLETVADSSSQSAVLDHLEDLRVGAGGLHGGGVARSGSLVGLHQAWVVVCPGGGDDSDTTFGFLHYDGEDEALVNVVCFGGDGFDGAFDAGNFVFGVVGEAPSGASGKHVWLVHLELWKWMVSFCWRSMGRRTLPKSQSPASLPSKASQRRRIHHHCRSCTRRGWRCSSWRLPTSWKAQWGSPI